MHNCKLYFGTIVSSQLSDIKTKHQAIVMQVHMCLFFAYLIMHFLIKVVTCIHAYMQLQSKQKESGVCMQKTTRSNTIVCQCKRALCQDTANDSKLNNRRAWVVVSGIYFSFLLKKSIGTFCDFIFSMGINLPRLWLTAIP